MIAKFYKFKSLFNTVSLLFGILLLSSTVHAQCVISGADLLSYPGATFPTTTPTTTGTSLVFGTGSIGDQVVMTLPIIPAGNLLPTSDFNVTVKMYMKRISTDNDPLMGMTDGNMTNFSGVIANDGSSHFDINGTIAGNTFSIVYNTVNSCNGSCGTAVNDTYTVDMTFDVTAGVTSSTFTTIQGMNTQTSSITYPQTYDPSTGINFVLGRQSAGESYQVDSVDIICASAPLINSISSDVTICEGLDTLLYVSASGGSSTNYQWQLNGVDVPGATGDTLEITPAGSSNAGVYTCIVSNPFGSDTTTAVNVNVNLAPNASIGGPNSICIGDTITLMGNATGGTPGYSYEWMPNASTTQNPSVSPTNDITYILTVTDGNGCLSAVDSLEMTVNALPSATIVADSIICPGGAATLVATATGGTSPYMYTWNPGALNTASVTVNPTSTTSYSVTVSDSNSCSTVESATVIVYAGPTSAFTYSSTGVDTVSFLSSSTGAITWSWDFGDGSTSNLENPEHIYTAAGTYDACLTTIDSNGCSNTICQTIVIGSNGIISNDPMVQIHAYPNPADQFVNLAIENGTKMIRINDINGKLVYEQNNPNGELVHIPLDNWSNGVYLIHIVNGQGILSTDRLSVNH